MFVWLFVTSVSRVTAARSRLHCAIPLRNMLFHSCKSPELVLLSLRHLSSIDAIYCSSYFHIQRKLRQRIAGNACLFRRQRMSSASHFDTARSVNGSLSPAGDRRHFVSGRSQKRVLIRKALYHSLSEGRRGEPKSRKDCPRQSSSLAGGFPAPLIIASIICALTISLLSPIPRAM